MSDIEKDLMVIPYTARSFDYLDYVVCINVYEKKIQIALSEIKKLQAENAELRKQSEWISVDDGLPDYGTDVWIYNGVNTYDAKYDKGGFHDEYGYDDCVTHYMIKSKPLPPKPKGE